MSSKLKFFKVNGPPGNFQGDSVYLYRDTQDRITLAITDTDGNVLYTTHSSTSIMQMVTNYLADIINEPNGIAGLDINGKIPNELLNISNNGNSVLRNIYHGNIAQISGTSQINVTNTAPLISQGTQLFSQIVTPESIDSKFVIDFSILGTVSTNGRGALIAIFRDNTFLTLGQHWDNINYYGDVSVHLIDTPNTLANVTYSARVGIAGGNGTWYLGRGTDRNYGGGVISSWSIKEMLLA